MSFLDTIARAKAYLEQHGRVSLRALRREFALDDATLDELVEELVEVQRVASREGSVLVATSAIRSESATAAWPTDATTRPATRPPTPSAHPADQVEARKVVTIIFADLIGSTSLHERLDAESTRRLMDRYYRALRTAIEAHGGTVVKLMGDGVMAAFGVPHVAEDDAIRAVRAAVAMQQAFRSLADEQSGAIGRIGLRIGVNTGEVIAMPESVPGLESGN